MKSEMGQGVSICDNVRRAVPANPYRYNGKELNTDLGLEGYDYGARWYDPVVGRFTGVDPVAEKFAWVTGYNYAENKIPGAIDLWGLQAWIVRYDHMATGEIEQSWHFDESKEAIGGVYEEHFYYDGDGYPTSARTTTASYSDYPKEFLNQGNYEQKSLFTIEAEGGITNGHAAMELGVEGLNAKAGFNLQAGNYLLGGVYNSDQGFEPKVLETKELEIRAEVSYANLGVSYSNTMRTTDGQLGAGNATLSVGPPIIETRGANVSIANANASSIFVGPEMNLAMGIGVRLRFGFRFNYPKSFTSFEKREMEALKNKINRP